MHDKFSYNGKELFPEIAQGNEAAFRALFDEFIQPLSYFALQLCGNSQEAEDIACIAFQKVWERRQSFTSMQAIKSFLYTTTRNHCLNYLKHKKVMSAAEKAILNLAENEEWADSKMVHTELLAKIYAEIEALPERHREIVLMSFVQELNTQEIADKLGRSPDHVRADKSRAIGLLRTSLAKKSLLETALILLAALSKNYL